jgi:hypothetical protein
LGSPRPFYETGLERCSREAERLDRRSNVLSSMRLASVLLSLALVGLAVWTSAGTVAWTGALVLGVAFVALVVVHGRIIRARDKALAGKRHHELGLARLAGELAKLPSRGEHIATAGHAYAGDIDLFGKASLLALVDATQTQFGEARLIAWLDDTTRPTPFVSTLSARQAAVRDLAARPELRETLAVLGAVAAEGKPDPTPLFAWAESKDGLGGALLRAFTRAWPFVVVGTLLVGRLALHLPPGLLLMPYAVAFTFAFLTRPRAMQVSQAVTQHEGSVAAYVEMLHAVEAATFEAPLLRELQGKLTEGRRASEEIGRLATIVGFLEARSNEVFRLFLSPAILIEQNCVLWLESWRARAGGRVRGWFEALGELEALASLAQLAFDNPEWAFPELAEEPIFDAEGLAHPLIPASRRVANDVSSLAPGRAFIVTGSNMSGKSTLLRALGANAVLGLAGAPVCARKMRLGPVRVATSMRIDDSLEQGVSHFYAELKRLKQIVERARAGPGVLFLLDEILHGTNTRERLIGARAVVRSLLGLGALGAVSTHDLSLGDLEQEMPEVVRNVHFEEQVEGEVMSFDYRLRQGVVQSSNALRLMKAVGLEVGP